MLLVSKSLHTFSSFDFQEIKKIQPSGPYNIAGFSGGSPVAYEIANKLSMQSEKVTYRAYFLEAYQAGLLDLNKFYELPFYCQNS